MHVDPAALAEALGVSVEAARAALTGATDRPQRPERPRRERTATDRRNGAQKAAQRPRQHAASTATTGEPDPAPRRRRPRYSIACARCGEAMPHDDARPAVRFCEADRPKPARRRRTP